MRTKLLSVLVLAAAVTGCISPSTRTEPPAPVYERGQRVGEAQNSTAAGVETTAIAAPAISVGVYQDVTTAPPRPEPATVVAEPANPQAAASSAPAVSGRAPSVSSDTPAATQVAYAAPPTVASSTQRPMSTAGDSLVKKADTSLQQGDLTGAASHLERAVRVDPNHPLPWNRLAHVRFEQGSYPLAEELAQKSNALAGSDSALKRNNWELIAAARQAAGDLSGAHEARDRAAALR